ncbi:LisH motif-containing protein [Teratosphaeria destructans]|uniref:LisH motif-containing protein n=1 Tax=Teratosphaeria destructans TaxID=418781 RepID=A0A9W7SSG5_9PEZI|nr:LisH motif-containing protein [Teratosphaeria destructans]
MPPLHLPPLISDTAPPPDGPFVGRAVYDEAWRISYWVWTYKASQSSSTVSPPSTILRASHAFERKVEEMKASKSACKEHTTTQASQPSITANMGFRIVILPHWRRAAVRLPAVTRKLLFDWDRLAADTMFSRSDINWVIMDYLVSEGYPGAAEKFAQETNLPSPVDNESIRERVRVRHAIHRGRLDEAIEMINEIDPSILDDNHLLHFHLLQLQLIEIIRNILSSAPASGNIAADSFRPALQFATEQLAPRVPTGEVYKKALERTMALMIYPPEKMTPELKQLLDLRLRETVAIDVNKAILESRGERSEAKIRQLIRARAWAETEARAAKVDLPAYVPIGLDAEDLNGADGDAMVS